MENPPLDPFRFLNMEVPISYKNYLVIFMKYQILAQCTAHGLVIRIVYRFYL